MIIFDCFAGFETLNLEYFKLIASVKALYQHIHYATVAPIIIVASPYSFTLLTKSVLKDLKVGGHLH